MKDFEYYLEQLEQLNEGIVRGWLPVRKPKFYRLKRLIIENAFASGVQHRIRHKLAGSGIIVEFIFTVHSRQFIFYQKLTCADRLYKLIAPVLHWTRCDSFGPDFVRRREKTTTYDWVKFLQRLEDDSWCILDHLDDYDWAIEMSNIYNFIRFKKDFKLSSILTQRIFITIHTDFSAESIRVSALRNMNLYKFLYDRGLVGKMNTWWTQDFWFSSRWGNSETP